jgi:hypothetical protein
VNIPRYRRRADAARYVRETWGMPCSLAWLAKLAVVGGGPIFRKAGRFPIYLDSDLDIWAEARISSPRNSTSVEARGGHQWRELLAPKRPS